MLGKLQSFYLLTQLWESSRNEALLLFYALLLSFTFSKSSVLLLLVLKLSVAKFKLMNIQVALYGFSLIFYLLHS